MSCGATHRSDSSASSSAVWQKAPEQRYRETIYLRDKLTALRDELTDEGPGLSQPRIGGRPIRKEPSSDTEVLVSLLRRHRTVAIAGGVALAAATLVGFWALWGQNIGTPAPPWDTEQLTFVPGPVLGMDWSPRGESIVFSHISEGSFNIAKKTTTVAGWVDLTTTPEDEIDPRWSPDGEWIAYLRDLPGGATIELVRPIPGSEPPQLLANTNMRVWAGKAQAVNAMGASPWGASLDGTFFLYPQLNESTGACAIYRIDLETRETTQLTYPGPDVYDMAPSLSPDGQRIVFQRADNTGQGLWLVPAAGGEAELLFYEEVPAGHPDWSLDGNRVVLDSRRAGSVDIWEIDVDDPQIPRQVTNAPGIEIRPMVAPMGGIGYYTFEHRSDVYRQRIDDVEAELDPLVRETPIIDNFGARMSPDGRHAVYYSTREGNYDLWLLDLASGNPYPDPRPLTRHPRSDILADWSRDGQIVFLSQRDGPYQLWSLDPDRPDPPVRIGMRPIMNTFAGNSFSQGPRVSRDDKQLIAYLAAAADGDGIALWTISPDGTGEREHDLPGVIWFGWYLDSRRVIYTRLSEDETRTELWAANLESGVQRALLHEAVDEFDVAPDGSAVAYQTAVSHISMRLWVLELTEPDPSDGLPRAKGAPRQLPAAGGIWHVHNSSWSWDSTAILYTRDADEGDVYVTEERR